MASDRLHVKTIAAANASADFVGTLSAVTPFKAIILKPTAASFETSCSIVTFTNAERMLLVLFTNDGLENTSIGQFLASLNIAIPDNSQGMWVINMPLLDNISPSNINEIQLFQITDGETILMPEVNLAELTGLESADCYPAIEDAGGLFQGCLDTQHINITSIAGCDICFRFTRAQALQYLLDQATKRLPGAVCNCQCADTLWQSLQNTNLK